MPFVNIPYDPMSHELDELVRGGLPFFNAIFCIKCWISDNTSYALNVLGMNPLRIRFLAHSCELGSGLSDSLLASGICDEDAVEIEEIGSEFEVVRRGTSNGESSSSAAAAAAAAASSATAAGAGAGASAPDEGVLLDSSDAQSDSGAAQLSDFELPSDDESLAQWSDAPSDESVDLADEPYVWVEVGSDVTFEVY